MKKVIMILGPTAVGKSGIAIELAKKINGEIISADSVQIYRDLDIGSAKITQEEMQGICHYGINIVDSADTFNVYEFVEYTKEKIEEIIDKGKVPIIVGGTGLYIKALTLGYNFGGVNKDENLREDLEKIVEEKGTQFLYQTIYDKDPKIVEKISKTDKKRLIRAYEIAFNDGVQTINEVDYDYKVFALDYDRQKLYDRINQRVDKMILDGLLNEVENLSKAGLTKDNQSMKAIGYKEVLDYFDGVYDYDTMIEKIKQHTRNYAKRQLTFIRGMQNIEYINVENREEGLKKIERIVEEWI